MIKFNKKIVQFGFGAVGKSFYEKVKLEINFNENNYYIITRDLLEFDDFILLGGLASNFIVKDVDKNNFSLIFNELLSDGDLLIDFADTVGTKDILKWCIDNKIMYINTGEADWPDNWYSIFEENKLKVEMKNNFISKYPILLQHGNNPGLVSYFVKEAIEYIIKRQFKKDKYYNKLLKEKKYNRLAQLLEVEMIHINDIDLVEVKDKFSNDTLVNTWCIDSFFFELLSEATINVGSHENLNYSSNYNIIDKEKGYLELKKIAINTSVNTYYPGGYFSGYLVPHEETITIADNLEVIENGKVCYKPTVIFVYSPCNIAKKYFIDNRVDKNNISNSNIRGYLYPDKTKIIYNEDIVSGNEYVGVLLIGKNFKSVWVGNKVDIDYLSKNKKHSYWQTPTITPVSMSTLAGVCWMIKNQDKGGIYFPDEIDCYKGILKIAEKYISKTIYKTVDVNIKSTIDEELLK